MKTKSISKNLSLIRGMFLIAAILLSAFGGPALPAKADNAGNAIQFNGSNQYVTFGTGNALASPTYTIETWFKRTGPGVGVTTGTGGISSAIPLVTKGTSESESANVDINYFLGIDANTGVLIADFEEGAGGAAPSQNHPVSGTTVLSNNVWYHAAVTYDGTTLRIYLNGIQENSLVVGQPTASATTSPTAFATSIRSNGTTIQGYFNGVLDEIRIWNVVRTQTQIHDNMNSELTSGTGLIGRWGMNEGSGSTINSSVGTYPGSLINSPTWVTGFPLPDSTPPAAPTGLIASPFNGGSSLAWNANSEPDLGGYNLYRGNTTGGPYTKINGALIIGTSYTDSGLTNGADYFYVARAVDTSTNESGNSNEVIANPQASLGNGLTFDGINDYVTFGLASDLGAKTFTLETWFKRSGEGATTILAQAAWSPFLS